MKSLFVGVSKPAYRGRGWVAQSKPDGLWKGGFDSQEEAAAWLANALGVRRQSLLRQVSAKPPELVVSRFRGVVHRRRSHGGLWEARGQGGTYISSHKSEQGAAKVVARVRGVPVSKLKRKQPFTRRAACALFRASYQVFQRYVPGDLQHLCKQEHTSQKVFQKETCGRLVVRLVVSLSLIHI